MERFCDSNIINIVDDIAALAEDEQELEAMVDSLEKIGRRYKREIKAKKTK